MKKATWSEDKAEVSKVGGLGPDGEEDSGVGMVSITLSHGHCPGESI